MQVMQKFGCSFAMLEPHLPQVLLMAELRERVMPQVLLMAG